MFGYHVSKNGRSMKDAVTEELKLLSEKLPGKHAVQIFCTGPQNSRETLTADDKAVLTKLTSATTATVIHGAYVDFLWKGSPSAIANVKRELAIAEAINATGVVVHLGREMNSLEMLKELNGTKATLWLEVNANKPSPRTYDKIPAIKDLFSKINELNLDYKVGFCIDTAHLFGSGCSLSSREEAEKWVTECVEALMVCTTLANPPIMFHLNDSDGNFASGQDRHAPLFEGKLWSAYKNNIHESGCAWIVKYCKERDIVCILERDGAFIEHDLAYLSLLV